MLDQFFLTTLTTYTFMPILHLILLLPKQNK